MRYSASFFVQSNWLQYTIDQVNYLLSGANI